MHFVVYAKDEIDKLYMEHEIKRFYPEAKITLCKNREIAVDLLENNTVDALVSDEDTEFKDKNIDHISFTSYEDYFYQSRYRIKKASVTPIIELLAESSKYTKDDILTLPGRVSKFFEDSYDVIKRFKVDSVFTGKSVLFNVNCRYHLYYRNLKKNRKVLSLFHKTSPLYRCWHR